MVAFQATKHIDNTLRGNKLVTHNIYYLGPLARKLNSELVANMRLN